MQHIYREDFKEYEEKQMLTKKIYPDDLKDPKNYIEIIDFVQNNRDIPYIITLLIRIIYKFN